MNKTKGFERTTHFGCTLPLTKTNLSNMDVDQTIIQLPSKMIPYHTSFMWFYFQETSSAGSSTLGYTS